MTARGALAYFEGCAITRRQGVMLADHLENPERPRPVATRDRRTALGLESRAWLVFSDNFTRLSPRGRRAAAIAVAALANAEGEARYEKDEIAIAH